MVAPLQIGKFADASPRRFCPARADGQPYICLPGGPTWGLRPISNDRLIGSNSRWRVELPDCRSVQCFIFREVVHQLEISKRLPRAGVPCLAFAGRQITKIA